jgi:hypothetical protein
METTDRTVASALWDALGGPESAASRLEFTGEGALPSIYPVTELAGASVACASLAIAELIGQRDGENPAVTVDRRLASFWFGSSLRPVGWERPAQWDPIAGDYRTRDGWIRLHTNAPHHRDAALRVLGRAAEKAAVAHAASAWEKETLESAVVEAGGCAAEMRSVMEWAAHPQGQAVAAEPLVHIETEPGAGPANWRQRADRPLAGVRVLDLTRVLAGPVASRFLAGYGAEVLRIDPPWWDEPAVVPEMTLGKRCARLDLREAKGRRQFEALLAGAHVFLHGYRSDALDRLGYDAATRRKIAPGLIDVALCAYGWSGPWRGRRGFDSLVQMSAGIAQAGMEAMQADAPKPLPVQAIDHATGYLMAAATVRGVTRRMASGEATTARASLARTAKLLTDLGRRAVDPPLAPQNADDLTPGIEQTDWGEARRLRPPAEVAGAPMRWELPARRLGTSEAAWAG